MPYDLCEDIPSLDIIETEMTKRGKERDKFNPLLLFKFSVCRLSMFRCCLLVRKEICDCSSRW